jgi:hypothetical protein
MGEAAHFWYTGTLFSAIPYLVKSHAVDAAPPSPYFSTRRRLFFHIAEIGTPHAMFTTLGLP